MAAADGTTTTRRLCDLIKISYEIFTGYLAVSRSSLTLDKLTNFGVEQTNESACRFVNKTLF